MSQGGSRKNPLALIIEDDQKIATIFANALRTVGYETEIAGDGAKAISRLKEIVPATVILDLHLPRVSGRDILSTIRTDKRLTQTKVMIVTADSILAEGLAKDADYILLKPISFSQLRDLATQLRPDYL